MFETLLQVMSNDGFEVIICSATQTSFNGVNNTGGEANLKMYVVMVDSTKCDSCYHQSEKR